MYSIRARNVNVALAKGIELMKAQGVRVESRNGPTL